MVQTRLPQGEKVLLCTTTNKAIDSLAEKLYDAGHRDVVAFGNTTRLGRTALTLTLPSHLARHQSHINLSTLQSETYTALNKWNDLTRAAEAKATDEISRNSTLQQDLADKRDEVEMEWLVRLFRPMRVEWEERLARLMKWFEEVMQAAANSERLSQHLAGTQIRS